MKILYKNKLAVICLSIILMIGLCFAVNNMIHRSSSKTIVMNPSYIADFSDDTVLIGFSQNTFIGEVVSTKGSKKLGVIPETQFNVKVIENIKGNLSGTIVVNQEGGYLNNTLYVMENDVLLETGKIYLFATRYNESEKFYTLVPVHGKVKIDTDKKIKDFSDRFTKAFKEEKHFDESKGAKK